MTTTMRVGRTQVLLVVLSLLATVLTVAAVPAAAQQGPNGTTVVNPGGGQDPAGADGLEIHVSANLQLQVRHRGVWNMYNDGQTTESNSLYNGVYLGVGQTLVGGDPAGPITSILDDRFTELGQTAITGVGTAGDPWRMRTELYWDVDADGSYNSEFDWGLNHTVTYTAPDNYFRQEYSVVVPQNVDDALDDVQLYHAIDSLLGADDTGPAYALDENRQPTTDVTVDPSLVGVRKDLGEGEIFMAFLEVGTDEFAHWYSGHYNARELYEDGMNDAGDIENALDTNASTDNGFAVQYGLVPVPGEQNVSNILTFDRSDLPEEGLCVRAETTMYDEKDGFTTPTAASPVTELTDSIVYNGPFRGFDDLGVNKYFAHSIPVEGEICGAQLTIGFDRPLAELWQNDQMGFRFLNSDGTRSPDIWHTSLDELTAGSGGYYEKTFNLDHLPFTTSPSNSTTLIEAMNNYNRLDVVLQDDTNVDYIRVDFMRTAGSDELCGGQRVTINMQLGNAGVGTAGDDVILGTNGNDVIQGFGGNDIICALDGDDWVDAGNGDDWVSGGNGNDLLDGGIGPDSGDDRMYGGDGRDEMYGHDGRDRLFGGQGNDRMFGGANRDRLVGNKGADEIQGNSGRDRIVGSSGDDLLYGNGGLDRISGGAGFNVANGGAADALCRGVALTSTNCIFL